MYDNKELDKLFNAISDRFFGSNEIGAVEAGKSSEPLYYGCTVTVGSDGKPIVKEYGNVRPNHPTASDDALVDTIVDEKSGQLKLVAEIPGVEKEDISVTVDGDTINICAEHDVKKYNISVPISHRILKDSAKATYKNGILEVVFTLNKTPKGIQVEVN